MDRIDITYRDGKRIPTDFDQLNRDYELDYCTTSCGITVIDHLDALDRNSLRGFASPPPSITTDYSYAGTDTLVTQIVNNYNPSGAGTYAYTYNKGRQAATESQTGTILTIEGAAVASYTNNAADRIATHTGTSFGYDGNGDLTFDGIRTYTYDQEADGRVLTASATGLTASYAYDPFGRRYSKTVNGTTTVYVYDNLGKIASEYSSSGAVLRDYAYFSREPGPVSTWEANGNINYMQHDRLGTLVALSGGNSGGQELITNWYAQPDYGTTDLFTNGVTFGYAGYYFDQETGLYKTQSRYYDPRLGRFLSPDPIRQQGGLNIYAYAGNDPVNSTDPTGLDTAVIIGGPIASNPFGHVAIAVTGGGVYSYGTTEPFGSSTTNYLLNQSTYRNSVVIIIPTTPQQEAAIVQVMNSYKGVAYSSIFCNCATAVINALSAAGIGNDYFNGETSGPPNLPATAEDIALQQPGSTTTYVPQGSTSVPAALNQFNPGSQSLTRNHFVTMYRVISAG